VKNQQSLCQHYLSFNHGLEDLGCQALEDAKETSKSTLSI